MKLRPLAAMFLLAAPMFGQILFSENFEGGTLSDGNWGTNLHGAIAANPLVNASNPSNDVLKFTGIGSGGDLFGIVVPYASASSFQTNGGFLTLSFDFLRTSSDGSGYIGTNHSSSGSVDEQWLWNNLGGGVFGSSNPPINTWTRVGFSFQPVDSSNVGTIGLKLEENQGTLNTVFFDNITLSAVSPTPEPAAFGYIILGLGALALRSRKRLV